MGTLDEKGFGSARMDATLGAPLHPAYIGETIFFTDESEKSFSDKSVPDKAATFSWSPTNPEIGESVSFRLEGVVGDIEKATWSMGGTGCDGADSTPECTPSLWNDCKAQAYKYASAGAKDVTLTVRVGGVNFAAPPTTVTVASNHTAPKTGSAPLGVTETAARPVRRLLSNVSGWGW